MKLAGYFVGMFGEQFRKDFADSDELMEFVRKAKELGTLFIGAVSVPVKTDAE